MATPAGRRRTSLDTSTNFVEIHGHQRAYRICGRGPALLLLHGIGDSSVSWVPLMRPLAERFTVIAPDLLGHGESAKPRA
ncbi:MAG: alpha/beta fold hydrolase, partial [Actinobacteria bacterium]|nr:alpha/beta fold hydrolase [Actinomycetota bacterium]